MTRPDAAPIRTYRAFSASGKPGRKFRAAARTAAIAGLSLVRSPSRTRGWIRFPYYHHVFDDERAGFARHLKYFKAVGEIVGIDDAVAMLASGTPIDGRYFCITFDDGFKNWIENAVPILLDHGTVAAFFLAAGYIGTDPAKDRDKLLRFYEDGSRLMEFLDWADCRRMIAAGMTIGSHSVDHVHLLDLDDETALDQLVRSRVVIERETGAPCLHFCCPFGRAGIDYDPRRHPAMAERAGYSSFLTTRRGPNRTGDDVFAVKRDHMLANASLAEVRYFLGDWRWAG